MKKRKILSLLLSLCLLISLLPTVALAADQEASAAGVQITKESYDSVTSILTVNVQIKMPDNSGITSVGTLLSYDSSKLTLLHKTKNTTTYTPSDPKISAKPSVLVTLENSDEDPYNTDGGVDLYGTGNRAGLFVGLGTTGQPSDGQKTTDWLTIYQLRFKVSGDPTVVLNSDSLRIADPAKDNDVIKGAYAANDYYTVSVNSYGSQWFKYGKMAANTEPDLTGNHWAIPAANVTATYPGSTNSVTPPATYTVTVQDDGNGTASASPATAAAGTEITLSATADSGYHFKEWQVVSGGVTIAGNKFTMPSSDVTVKAIFEADAPTTYAVTVENDGHGSGTASPATAAAGTEITLSATANSGYHFKEWQVVSGTMTIAGNKFAMPSSDVTVKAIFEENAPTTYTVTFNANGGTASADSMQTGADGKLTSLPTATRSGSYSFDGWYTAASGGTQITTAYVFSANTTVYAHWTYTGGGGGSYYAPVVPDMPMLYRGCTGDAVKTLQEKLNAKGFDSGNVDGIFGAKTYAAATAFQKANGLGVDGIVGKLTWAKLYDATPVNVTPVTTQPMLRTGSRGDAVRKLQELLNAKGYTCGSVDGIFGSKTYAAVLAFQKANGLAADGIVGSLTWGKLV